MFCRIQHFIPCAILRCYLYHAICSTLVSLLLSIGGVYFPRSQVSHSSRSLLAGCCAGTFGDAGLSSGLLSAVSGGLQAVWSASGSDLPAAGRGVVGCAGCPESYLSSLAVSSAADQFMLLTDEAVRDMSRHSFLRNVLHHLIRTPEALPVADARPASTSAFHAWGVHGEDALVQLQCTLILFEGHLASAAGARYGGSGASGMEWRLLGALFCSRQLLPPPDQPVVHGRFLQEEVATVRKC